MSKSVTPTRSPALRKISVVVIGVLLTVAMATGLGMAVFPTRIAAAASVNGLDLSLLPRDKAEKVLAAWWANRSAEEFELFGPDPDAEPVVTTISEIGVELDVEATLAQLPLDTFEDWVDRTSQRSSVAPVNVRPVYNFTSVDAELLESVIAQTSPPLAPAKVLLDEDDKIVHTAEVSSMSLVLAMSLDVLRVALDFDEPCVLPAVFSDKLVPDKALYSITDVVSTFSTTFSAYNRSRSENLRVAAEKLDGVILMPGEVFSFNDFVGKRTSENGFKKAGVYRKGKHDIDWGGGVCQVSTTLFNAAIFANLEIEKRGNHTFTVPYVPLGRDAAVSYGELDMKFVNTMDTPIAIASKWVPGKLTFTLLGTKEESVEIKIIQRMTESWEHETQYIEDPELELDTEEELEKGGKGYKAITHRIVYKDGVEISRETLCRSHYRGGPKIIAKGTKRDFPADPFGTIPPIGS